MRHRSSVTLSQRWMESLETSDKGDLPPAPPTDEIAFFPLPSSGDTAEYPPDPMESIRSLNDVLRSSRRELLKQDLAPSVSERDVVRKSVSAILAEKDLDDMSFGSVETVASSEFSERMADDFWETVPMGPPDAILGIAQAYRACPDPRKVNVCVGAYRDGKGSPWVLPSVREAEHILLDDESNNREYLPIEGDRDFVQAAMKFAYGCEMPMEHLAAVQTLSGTGACRIGGEFLAQFWPGHPIYLPDPTWGNHISIFQKCGLDVRRYRYYSRAVKGLDLRAMLRDLIRAPDGSIVLLHACAHNPTGKHGRPVSYSKCHFLPTLIC